MSCWIILLRDVKENIPLKESNTKNVVVDAAKTKTTYE